MSSQHSLAWEVTIGLPGALSCGMRASPCALGWCQLGMGPRVGCGQAGLGAGAHTGAQPHTGAQLMHLSFISHGCSAEAGAEHGVASQGSDTVTPAWCRWQLWAGEVTLQSVRLPGPVCTPGRLLCSSCQGCVLVLQDGVSSQGMGAVPRVGSRNHTEMPLGKFLAPCHWRSL